MDKSLIAHKFSKSLSSYNQEAKAQKIIVSKLIDVFSQLNLSRFDKILEFGTGTGLLTQEIHKNYKYTHLYLNDLSNEFKSFALSHFNKTEQNRITFLSGDIEEIVFPDTYDLIISSSTEQWIENKLDFYKKIHNALKPEAYFVFSGFGINNLKELRKATGISLNYYSLSEIQKQLSNYFEIIHTEEQLISLNFDSALSILTHIKKTGVNAISKQAWTQNSVKRLLNKIEKVCKQDEQFRITYHPTYFILKKKQLIQ